MPSSSIRISTAVTACLAFALLSVRAVPIYSTLGPEPYTQGGPAFTFGWSYSVGSGLGSGHSIAAPFSFVGSAYQLQSITVDIGLDIVERTPNIQIGIFYDDGGHPSLTPVTMFEPNPSLVTTAQRQLITYAFPGQTVLTPNTSYWIAFQPHTVGATTNAYNGQYTVSS